MSHIERMKAELDELEVHSGKLDDFIGTEIYNGLSSTEQHLLCAQVCIMSSYINILKLRIEIAENNANL